MTRRNLIYLIAVLVLGGLAFWFIRNQGAGTIRKELSDFAVTDTASVTKVYLIDKGLHAATLTREADGWKVNGKFIARPDAINYLLQTMHDLTVQSPVGKKARENVIKRLATGGTKVEVYVGDKLVKKYYVGDETMEGTGTYMLLSDPESGENSTEPFVMEIKGFTGYLNSRYFTRESEWRDRTVFRYYAPNIRSVKFEQRKNPALGYVVTQGIDGKTFGLTDIYGKASAFDTIAVKQYLSYFNNIGFETIENGIKPTTKDSIIRSGHSAMLTVTDDKGKVNQVKFYMKYGNQDPAFQSDTIGKTLNGRALDVDRLYATINNGQDFVVVQYFVFGKLMQTPDYFLQKK
ncbi:MAG: DUF4340 domain-containing protein [Bacteroidia bacterium]